MGQRHQAYFIARILSLGARQPRYRCVAATHHQWCNGTAPILAARRAITLAKQETNSMIIRSELSRLSRIDFREIHKPSHYLSHFLFRAFRYGLEKRCVDSLDYVEHAILPAYMRIDQGDNNDGITVIDITDPTKCAYLFMTNDGVFQTAEGYARSYGTGDQISAAIAPMKDVPLISMRAMSEVWPDEVKPDDSRGAFDSPDIESYGKVSQPQALEDFPAPPLAPDLTLLPVLRQAIKMNDFTGLGGELISPEKARALLSILRETADFQPINDKTLPFVSKLLKSDRSDSDNADVLNLSRLQLSPKQICSLLQENSDIQVLDLSHNSLVDIHAMKTILEAAPPIRKLIVLGTATSSQDWTSLLRDSPDLFKHLEAVIHPSFFNSEVQFRPQFAFYMVGYPHCQTGRTALPFFTPSQIIQGIQVLLRMFVSSEDNQSPEILSYDVCEGISSSVALSAETLRPGAGWAERDIPFFAPYRFTGGISEATWAFVLHMGNGTYGFLEFDRSASSNQPARMKVYDLEGFLQKMDDEGRVPPEFENYSAVQMLLKNLTVRRMNKESTTDFRVMDVFEAEEVVQFLDEK